MRLRLLIRKILGAMGHAGCPARDPLAQSGGTVGKTDSRGGGRGQGQGGWCEVAD
jgi:hypothetical protein